MRIHEGTKNYYKCICGKGYPYSGSISTHRKTCKVYEQYLTRNIQPSNASSSSQT